MPAPGTLEQTWRPGESEIFADADVQARPAVDKEGLRRRRLLLSYVVTVFLLVTLNFFLPRALPGDPISALIEPGGRSYVHDDALRAELESYYGLDRPLAAQYRTYLANLAQGDLGTSIRHERPVSQLVEERLPWTGLLVVSAMGVAMAVGWLAGIHSGWRRGQRVDRGLLALCSLIDGFPVFFVGSLALLIFAVKLRWFPLAGASTPFSGSTSLPTRVADVAHHLVLPAVVMGLHFAASEYRLLRGSMVAELGSDYLVLGRAKGLRERRLKYRYTARNALLPVVSQTAVHFAFALTWATVLVEAVFAYRGMGGLTAESVAFRDYPALQGCFLVLSLVVVSANFVADVLYRRLDPRTAS
ncbi:MAG: ABC transporter permease [Actinomycetota bacterium]|nr:ABC transporter permease [Actinomycetota bacterium]